MAAKSRIFSPFRAIGYVSNHVPLALQVRGADHFVTTVVGKTFHIYNCAKLNLLFVGDVQKENIEALTTHGEYTVTSAKNIVTLWKRGKRVKQFNEHQFNVKYMLPFGEHIVSVDEQNFVKIWDVNDLDVYLTLSFQTENFDITTALHPNTYLNKILFGSRQGKLQLWNIKTSTLIYEFDGWSEPVLVLEQAPAIDVAAIGLENGKIVLHNLKYDETLMSFWQEFGPVTAISFRTDGTPVMATGSTAGHVSLWDLEMRQIHSIIRDCHYGNISGMKFLQNQPLMVTSGSDNTLKLWIFDNSDGSGRLLKCRTGHSEPPTKIRYYEKEGHVLLSAGLDRSLRYTSTIKDEQSCEMSQGSLLKKSKNLGVRVEELKLSSITDLGAEPTRASDWDNVVTCHSGSPYARTWRLQNKCIGKHTLGKELENIKDRVATAAKISSCGNFVVVGYSTGHMEIFNMQSGLHRGSFITIKQKAHLRPIRGIETDSANLCVISGATDEYLKFWSFKSRKLISYEKFDSPIRQMLLHRESALLAVSLEDFTVKIIDIDTKKIVRNFVGHQHSITDMAFSPDARWLITSSMDSSIRTWDLPSARLIDCFNVETPITSLTFSPTGDFLATTHLEAIGIYLWSNKTLYTDSILTPLPRDFQPTTVELPTTVISEDNNDTVNEEETEDEMNNADKAFHDYQKPDQISNEIITLSLLPESRWRSLLDLKLIKERNKPKEPPKKPKSAPFFLPTIAGITPKFDTSKKEEKQDDSSNVLPTNPFQEKTPFQKLLDMSSETKDYSVVIERLKNMSPSAIDVEFRLASPIGGGSITIMQQMLEFINQGLKSGKDYELMQAYLALFLKIHGKTVATEQSLRETAAEILETQKSSWNRCQELMNQSNCLINYFKNATL